MTGREAIAELRRIGCDAYLLAALDGLADDVAARPTLDDIAALLRPLAEGVGELRERVAALEAAADDAKLPEPKP